MKKSNINTFIKKMNKAEPVEVEIPEGCFAGMKIHIQGNLGIVDANSFVEEIVGSVVSMEDMTYQPEFLDFIVRLATLEYYAGFERGECPAEKLYDFVYRTDIYDLVHGHIDHVQYYALVNGARDKIEYIRNLQASAMSLKADELLDAMSNMISTGNEAVKAIDTKEFKDAVAAFVQPTATPSKPAKRRTKAASAEVK